MENGKAKMNLSLWFALRKGLYSAFSIGLGGKWEVEREKCVEWQ